MMLDSTRTWTQRLYAGFLLMDQEEDDYNWFDLFWGVVLVSFIPIFFTCALLTIFAAAGMFSGIEEFIRSKADVVDWLWAVIVGGWVVIVSFLINPGLNLKKVIVEAQETMSKEEVKRFQYLCFKSLGFAGAAFFVSLVVISLASTIGAG